MESLRLPSMLKLRILSYMYYEQVTERGRIVQKRNVRSDSENCRTNDSETSLPHYHAESQNVR